MVKNIIKVFKGYISYNGGIDQFNFIAHRISGLATLVFLSMHIFLESTVFYAPQYYDPINELLRSPAVMISEIFLAFLVIFHSVNGFRIVYLDMLHPEQWTLPREPQISRSVWSVSFILWLPAAIIMFRDVLIYGFGLE